jgi:tetratricopeptide (TPR) repeat protein
MLEAGEWDRAVEKIDAFLAESQLAPHYHDCYVLASRSVIRLARGDLEGALADQSAALNRAREIEDPQAVFPVLGVSAYVLAEAGRTEAACIAFAELMEAGPEAASYGIEEGIWAADILGRSNEFAALLSGSDNTRRTRASRAVLAAEFDTAAEIFSEMGALLSAAHARLRAAEQLVGAGRRAEADVQLRQALAFFRSVGAARYVRRGEALLAASA